jgi:hypothetical protein
MVASVPLAVLWLYGMRWIARAGRVACARRSDGFLNRFLDGSDEGFGEIAHCETFFEPANDFLIHGPIVMCGCLLDLLPQPFSEPKFQMHLIGGLSRHVPFSPLPPED